MREASVSDAGGFDDFGGVGEVEATVVQVRQKLENDCIESDADWCVAIRKTTGAV